MIPALDKAKEKRWSIEVYMWRHAIAHELKGRVKFKSLDKWIDRVTFTTRWHEHTYLLRKMTICLCGQMLMLMTNGAKSWRALYDGLATTRIPIIVAL